MTEHKTAEVGEAPGGTTGGSTVEHPDRSGERLRMKALKARSHELGLTTRRTGRIGARVNPELVREAKRRTGIETDSELVELALANLVIEDGFAEAFKRIRGAVDKDVDLEF